MKDEILIQRLLKKLLKKLKKQYGEVYVCHKCGNLLDFDGWGINDNNHMGNNYSYVQIHGKTYHWAICDCDEVVLLGRV